jgi:hypothetical protein
MAKPKKRQAEGAAVLFDVVYEDGRRTSNRKVPASAFNPFDGDAPARAFIEAEDRRIGALSGKLAGPIKQIRRSGAR